MIYYVMVITLAVTPIGTGDWEYIGHFTSCYHAQAYVKKNHPKAKASRCLLEEYIFLPKELEYKYHI